MYILYFSINKFSYSRSKTADIERMLHITRPKSSILSQIQQKNTTMVPTLTISDNKKYTKRRYTDSRHQTRHIPDAGSLTENITTVTMSQNVTSVSNSQEQRSNTNIIPAPVWKRRELISSTPKHRQNYA